MKQMSQIQKKGTVNHYFPFFFLFCWSGLLPRLLALPEEVIGHRLAVPLLSRFVLMDETAVSHVIPHLLSPKHGKFLEHTSVHCSRVELMFSFTDLCSMCISTCTHTHIWNNRIRHGQHTKDERINTSSDDQ